MTQREPASSAGIRAHTHPSEKLRQEVVTGVGGPNPVAGNDKNGTLRPGGIDQRSDRLIELTIDRLDAVAMLGRHRRRATPRLIVEASPEMMTNAVTFGERAREQIPRLARHELEDEPTLGYRALDQVLK